MARRYQEVEDTLHKNGRALGIRFEDMSEEESAPLLEYLNRHSQRPEFQIRFRWRKGSLALWDNRSTQHYAANDYYPERRRMERTAVVGDVPF